MKKKRYYLLGIIVFVLFIFLVGEIACRLYYDFTHSTRLLQLSPIKEAIYEFRPNSKEERCGTMLKINSMGFRDYEYKPEKPEGITRIFMLGDSVTQGSVALSDTFSKCLERLLGKQFEVWNLGITGHDSWKEAAMLREKWMKYDPDIIILAICLNDYNNSGQLYWVDCFGRFKYRANSKVRYFNWLYYHSDFYRFVYDRLYVIKRNFKSAGLPAEMDLSAEVLEQWEIPLKNIMDTCRNKKLIFVLFPMQNQKKGDFKKAELFLQKLCWKYNIPYLCLKSELKNEHFCDLLHFNEIGNQVVAQAIYKFLKQKSRVK